MKRLLIIFVVGTLFACKEEPKETVKEYTVVSGKVTNTEGNLTISSADRIFNKEIELAADGSFLDTLKVATNHYTMVAGEDYVTIYIEKGKDLTFNGDASDFIKTLEFSGNGSEINSYLIAKRRKEDAVKGDYVKHFSLGEEAFKTSMVQLKETISKMIADAKGIPEEYKAMEKKNIEYSHIEGLYMYEPLHGQFTENRAFEPSEGFLGDLVKEGKIDYTNEEDFEFSQDYRNLVSGHYRDQASKLIESDTSLSYDLSFFKATESIASPTIKNSLVFEAAEGISFTNDVEPFYRAFMANSTNEKHKAVVTEKYDKLKTVAKGRPSPKFVGYENYKGGTTSLDDLKGKFVYIDLWATWCRPCIAQIPALKEIEKQYHGKNIEFVSISVDDAKDYDKWKKMVADMALTGIQLFADNDFKSSFVEGYLVEGIPRFILIDPDGNIVNYTAPFPSEPRLVALFDELNI